MNAENILNADMLDILFENRNKGYGAYVLRKYYNERLYKALGTILLLSIVLCIYFMVPGKSRSFNKPEVITVLGSIQPTVITTPVINIKKAVQQHLIRRNTGFVQSHNLIPVIGDQIDHTMPTVINAAGDPLITNSSPSAQPGNADVDPVGQNAAGNYGDLVAPVDREKPMVNPEIMPSYPGGEAALVKFLQTNLENPEALNDDETITVKIRFIVGYDGILKGFETILDGGEAFNNEVIRVLRKMPRWIPGKTAGENVSVYYTIPVKFVQHQLF